MTTATHRRAFIAADDARMREIGMFTEDDRVALLDGELFVMSPIGPLPVALVHRLTQLLVQLGDDAVVSVPNAVCLNE